MSRIPPKGTNGYRRYWRDKEISYQLRELKTQVLKAKNDAHPASHQHNRFANAAMHMEQAVALFKEGWEQEYRP